MMKDDYLIGICRHLCDRSNIDVVQLRGFERIFNAINIQLLAHEKGILMKAGIRPM